MQKMTNDHKEYKLQEISVSANWKVVRNVFYDITPNDQVPEDDKYDKIYFQEDLVLITNNNYHLDLGWYGTDDFENSLTGYCIHLFRGESWLESELLVKIRTKNKDEIVRQINSLTAEIDKGDFENLTGYKVTKENTNDFGDFEIYDLRK